MHRKSWDQYYFDIAQAVASRSTCLSQKIGAILVKDKIVICEGYNGAARGVPSCGPERLKHDHSLAQSINGDAINPVLGDIYTCPRQRLGYPSGQGLHLCPAVHAEANCIANAARTGICTLGTTMYVTCGIPCKDCLSLIINAGVIEVVTEIKYYDELTDYIMSTTKEHILIRSYQNSASKKRAEKIRTIAARRKEQNDFT